MDPSSWLAEDGYVWEAPYPGAGPETPAWEVTPASVGQLAENAFDPSHAESNVLGNDYQYPDYARKPRTSALAQIPLASRLVSMPQLQQRNMQGARVVQTPRGPMLWVGSPQKFLPPGKALSHDRYYVLRVYTTSTRISPSYMLCNTYEYKPGAFMYVYIYGHMCTYVCMCTYVYLYMYTYRYIYTHIQIYMHTQTYIFIDICIYIYVHRSMYIDLNRFTFLPVHTHIYVFMYMWNEYTYACARTHTHIRTHKHTHTHTHKHTHTHTHTRAHTHTRTHTHTHLCEQGFLGTIIFQSSSI